jgi:hypothetical protein
MLPASSMHIIVKETRRAALITWTGKRALTFEIYVVHRIPQLSQLHFSLETRIMNHNHNHNMYNRLSIDHRSNVDTPHQSERQLIVEVYESYSHVMFSVRVQC